MKITEESINHNAICLIKDLAGTSYDMIMTDKDNDYEYAEERGFMLMTLGEINGIIDLADALKEVLKT